MKLSTLCKQVMLEGVFGTIPMVWELYDETSGEVLESVYADLRVENGVVLSNRRELVYTNNTDKHRKIGVRLVDQGGALYMECDVTWGSPRIAPGGTARVAIQEPCFRFEG